MLKTGLKFFLSLAAVTASGSALAQTPSKSVWDGVYTADQAARGKAQFDQHCAKCHGATLGGNEMAPPLSGAAFLDNWNGIAVGDLVERIQTTMPADDPGSLSRKTATDIVSYILSVNQIPAGSAELPSDAPIQAQFRIDEQKPAGK
ncbi:MAG TPA: cytochrome c [Rhizomicrobium sp.]|jgi:mono/diheme cytochrome c family protein|nr:cytochrome c [Rhizomicrobium sp.]